MLRRQFAKEAKEEKFEENLVRGIVLLAREMSWTIEYILEMDIKRFSEVSKVVSDFYEEQNKAMQQSKVRKMFR